MPAHFASIEPLEARIAPASFGYIDVDGDVVTIKTSKGTDQQLINILVRSSEGVPNGEELQRINFSMDPVTFKGTDLTVTAKRGLAGGDGLVNVGYIDATSADGGVSVDLGNIKISGDLGRIIAGDATTKTPGVKSLTVGSMGRYGTDTQSGGAPSLDSTITGGVGLLSVRGDVKGTSFVVTGGMTPADGKIGSIFIGGSLIGGSTGFSGFISATGGIAKVIVMHNIEGASTGDGQIFTGGKMGSVTIGGSIIGGGGFHSGRLQAGSFGSVLVKGNLVGANLSGVMQQNFAGAIESTGFLPSGSITIRGSILGGGDPGSGSVTIAGDLGTLSIGGDISSTGDKSGSVKVGGKLTTLSVRGSIFGGKYSDHGAYLEAGNFGKITIGGDVRGGEDAPFSGYLTCVGTVGSLTIGGSLVGGTDSDLSTNGGNEGRVSGNIDFLKVGSITIRGSVIGGSGDYSGQVGSNFTSLFIGGSLLGGQGKVSGVISSPGVLGPITIGGDIRGANAYNYDVLQSGAIVAKALTSVTVGGSIYAGQKVTGNTLTQSGFIGAEDSIGSITVKGSLIGNANNSVGIIARGQAVPGATADVAIGSVTIGGRVERALIGAGYSLSYRGLNSDAQIGKVSVGGDWIASSILAGVNPGANIATADDIELIGGQDFGSGPVKDNAALFSKIGSIVIKGGVFGTPGTNADSFGFVAQEIVAFKVAGTAIPLKPGKANDVFASNSAKAIGAGLSTLNPSDQFEIHVMEV